MKLKIQDTVIGWDKLFYLTIIALACFKVTYAVPKVMDILFYDESIYLLQGSRFSMDMLFKDGFVYRLWYLLLSPLAPDTVTLYYSNYILLIWLNPFLIYLLLRKLKVGMFYSTLFSLLFLISNVNVTAWPFITRFALALVLGTLILILRAKTMKHKYLIALGGLFLLVYTRPEYILTWIIFILTGAGFLVHRCIKTKKVVIPTVAILTLMAAGFVLISSPANTSRSMMAFGQHYALQKYKQGKISVNPNTNWKQVLNKDFQTDKSLTRAFLNNPGAMFRHVVANIKIIPYQTMEHLFPYGMKKGFIKKALLVILGLLFIIRMIFVIRKMINERREPGLDDSIFYFLAVIIMLPLLVSILFIYPREHYLLILFALLLIIAAKILPPIPARFRLQYVVLPVLLFLVPWQASSGMGLFPGKIENIHRKQCTNLKRIAFIKRVTKNSTPRLLSAGGSMAAYVKDLQHVNEQAKDRPFTEFLAEKKINMILLNHGLINDTRFAGDEQFKQFVSSLPNEKWEKLKIPGCPDFLAVKKSL